MSSDIASTRWVKASLSSGNGACVEVANWKGEDVMVRNSRDPEGPILRFTRQEWTVFLAGAKAGEFDAII